MGKKVIAKRNSRQSNVDISVPKSNVTSATKSKSKKKTDAGSHEYSNSSSIFPKVNAFRPYLIAGFAVFFGFCNSCHQATMFENDRHFSHLSTLEREMTFRTEMGLYYFYYKVMTEAPSMWSGLNQIMNDNLTEYPSTINTLERFNLYPEVVMAASYRSLISLTNYFNVSAKECWQVLRGDNLSPIESCEGIGDTAYFYTTCVFLFNGLVGSLIFLYGTFLSRSICGGLLSVASFFFNHGECTRVQWTPPLRESFGYPLFLLQMMLVTLTLRTRKTHVSHSFIIAVVTTFFILSWQFSHFALLTQVLVLFITYLQSITHSNSLKCILKGHMMSLIASLVCLFGNKMLMASFYTPTIFVCYVIVSNEEVFSKLGNRIVVNISKGLFFLFGCVSLKFLLTFGLHVTDDKHIWNLLKSKFSSYKDFHTMLYTCAAEFDFLEAETLLQLTKTIVLPVAVFAVLGILYIVYFVKYWKKKASEDSDVVYNISQFLVFSLMATLIMRLKLFFTPHLCLMASLSMSEKHFGFLRKRYLKYCILFGLFSAMCVQGVQNLKEQRNILGEFSNPNLEELITWINTTLPTDAVFAGPMPTMANLLLSTRRPIVNHPHYENTELRKRTLIVYQIFSRKPASDVYKDLLNMKINFIVVERNWCFGKRREGCAMVDLWDIENPENKHKESLCRQLLRNPFPFRKVFENSLYTVLAL